MYLKKKIFFLSAAFFCAVNLSQATPVQDLQEGLKMLHKSISGLQGTISGLSGNLNELGGKLGALSVTAATPEPVKPEPVKLNPGPAKPSKPISGKFDSTAFVAALSTFLKKVKLDAHSTKLLADFNANLSDDIVKLKPADWKILIKSLDSAGKDAIIEKLTSLQGKSGNVNELLKGLQIPDDVVNAGDKADSVFVGQDDTDPIKHLAKQLKSESADKTLHINWNTTAPAFIVSRLNKFLLDDLGTFSQDNWNHLATYLGQDIRDQIVAVIASFTSSGIALDKLFFASKKIEELYNGLKNAKILVLKREEVKIPLDQNELDQIIACIKKETLTPKRSQELKDSLVRLGELHKEYKALVLEYHSTKHRISLSAAIKNAIELKYVLSGHSFNSNVLQVMMLPTNGIFSHDVEINRLIADQFTASIIASPSSAGYYCAMDKIIEQYAESDWCDVVELTTYLLRSKFITKEHVISVLKQNTMYRRLSFTCHYALISTYGLVNAYSLEADQNELALLTDLIDKTVSYCQASVDYLKIPARQSLEQLLLLGESIETVSEDNKAKIKNAIIAGCGASLGGWWSYGKDPAAIGQLKVAFKI